MNKLEQLIRAHVELPSFPTPTGWYPVVCKVCNDHGKKGPRAGFRFDADATGYHCFNCGHSVIFDPHENTRIPKKLITIFNAFNIPEQQWQQYAFSLLGQHAVERVEHPPNFYPKEIPLPTHFLPLQQTTDKWGEVAKVYLEARGINWNDYPFYLATRTNNKLLDVWRKRVIIPIYKDNKLIFYIGRDLTNATMRKYLSPPISKENIMYGYDKLLTNTQQPLYITEGWFDGYAIDGVAILGNKLTKSQIYWLNRSPRKKVYIPDRLGNGAGPALKALQQQWSISTPDIGECKDINEAVVRYGKLYVLKQLVEQTSSGFEGEVKVRMYCK